MAKISVPYVVWRDGRPRFSPSPQMRALGIASCDLKHPSKVWFTIEESRAFVENQMARYLAARDGVVLMVPQAEGKAPAPLPVASLRQPKVYSFRDLFRDFFAHKEFRDKAPGTQEDYRYKLKSFEKHDPELVVSDVQSTRRRRLFDLWDTIDDQGGRSAANGVLRTISTAISWGMKYEKLPNFEFNPCLKMKLPASEARVRAWTPAEIAHVVATADTLGRPELGDAIIMGIWTGQRQGDRLSLVEGPLDNGRRIFRQSKTGAIVAIMEVPELAVRLAAAKERKLAVQAAWQAAGINREVDKEVIFCSTTQAAFKRFHYRDLFRKLVQSAYEGVVDKDGRQIVKPMKSMYDEAGGTGLPRDQDLRDTCVTWLANAGCSHSEIASVTGHTEQSIPMILSHYLAKDPVRADNAIAKMQAYRQR